MRNLKCSLLRFDLKGEKLLEKKDFSVDMKADLAETVLEIKTPKDKYFTVFDVKNDKGDLICRTFYRDGALPLEKTDAFRIVSQDDNSVTVEASKLLVSVFLDGDYVFDDSCFMMLPGEVRKISFKKTVTYGRDVSSHVPGINVTCYGLKLL